MSSFPRLNTKDINQPIQLLGASLIGSVLLVGEFLYASTKCPSKLMAWFFGITAILIFPAILYFIFILQTKYRIQLQGDKYYNKSMMAMEEQSSELKPFKLKKK